MNFLTKAVAAAALSLAPFSAFAAVLDFDSLTSSATPITTYSEDGFEFDVSFTTAGGAVGAAIFDSTCVGNAACGGDLDLKPLAQGDNGVEGNLLILQEANRKVADDDVSAGTITLTLTAGPAFRFIGASVIDDTTFTFFDQLAGELSASLLGSISIGPEGNLAGGTGQITFAQPSRIIGIGDSIVLGYGGSGGIDSLQLAAVPVPAALPLMLAGLGGLGLVARRRKTRAS
ncbi:VPLPA-CTERM sorting domain-containing protein [uncultured Roseobacter sp.]|uniref:VPLPA-CTERM sorting domain-containing protein n=1 Tax=uncultured Roseobacter sp. TaxID=114847 RepID=UPI0026328637|nr:VPLPA-CTERM sorting domain-containing protein [uncultured Roseobacter sp.]